MKPRSPKTPGLLLEAQPRFGLFSIQLLPWAEPPSPCVGSPFLGSGAGITPDRGLFFASRRSRPASASVGASGYPFEFFFHEHTRVINRPRWWRDPSAADEMEPPPPRAHGSAQKSPASVPARLLFGLFRRAGNRRLSLGLPKRSPERGIGWITKKKFVD
jgi:hypothetical protein